MAKLSEAGDQTLIKLYIGIRDKRAQRKADFNEADADDKSKQEKIEGELHRRMHERGLDSVSAKGVGTAYISTRSSATVPDWDSFVEFIKGNDAWEMLEHRANKIAVQQYIDEHGDLPPGVNWSETQTVNFRRK